MNMKVENEMALPITKSVTVMLLEPYAGKLARTVLRGESSRKGADLLDIEMYLNEAHSQGLRSVRCHCNVMAWAENEAELKRIRNDVGSQLALMGCSSV